MQRNAKTGQKTAFLTMCAAFLVVGYSLEKLAELSATKEIRGPAIRTVTFRSHPGGSLDDDPNLRGGERGRVT